MGLNTIEIFVKKKKNPMTFFVDLAIFALGIGIFIVIFKFAGVVAFVPLPFLLFASYAFAYKYNTSQNHCEFEYSYNAGTLNIDKILRQKIRKPVVNINVSDFTGFGRVNDADIRSVEKSSVKVEFCGESDIKEDSYYFTCNFESKGQYMFVFDPDERLLKALSASSPAANKYVNRNSRR